MLIEPASLAQVRTGRDGTRITIENDLLDVAKEIRAIDPSLSLHYNERGKYFVIVQTFDGIESLVLTANQLDQRIANRVRQIVHPDYDYADEADKMDAVAKKAEEHAFEEQVGEHGELLAHALRKDLGVQSRIYLPSHKAS